MTLQEIIDGLQMISDACLYDPNTGEQFDEPLNDIDKKTLDACKGAIELLSYGVQQPKIDKEKLDQVRNWLIENIFRNPDIMHDDKRFFETYGDPGERTVIDIADVIASLYEVLHVAVTGEDYKYMFHWANKIGAWVEDTTFYDIIYGGDQNAN